MITNALKERYQVRPIEQRAGAVLGRLRPTRLAMRVTIVQIKTVHTVIFAVLSACVLLVLYSGIMNRITTWTWVALVLLLLESAVLVACGWRCPLTILAERLGASQGAVADIFLPKWLADRIFPLCGGAFFVGCAILVLRLGFSRFQN